MRRIVGTLLLLGCAAQPRAGRPAAGPYKDAPVAVAVAAGTGSVVAGVAAAAAVTVVVGTVIIGAEQFPDPPAGRTVARRNPDTTMAASSAPETKL